ncbi:hypothetical protein [Kordiimonas sp. SCSIO 12610]|uniref:hypothetical protein n=1 Tax=Kordiimonas sp. SCSIO 12610 TaxID=2829597 RepID=UPI00210C779B|nr:hypothetical protein [Kordiimonas sp. SCSIO 12610]UTW56130.1 hypothetical protein KFF44_04335 [Kordiimonas sp. SCSIO 12610]
MSLDEIATIIDIIASVTVVISFIFIGFQIRQNTHALRMGAAQSSVQLLSDNMGRVVENRELAELLASRNDTADLIPLSELSSTDRLILSNFLSISFRHFEMLHTHRQYGIYEKELWLSTEFRMRQTLSRERVREWWYDNSPYYAPRFARFVDKTIRHISKEEKKAQSFKKAL